MPNAIDLFPQNNKVSNDPTNTLAVNTNNYIQPYPFDPEAAAAALQQNANALLAGLQAIGADLGSVVPGLGQLINGLWSGFNGILVDLGLEPSPEQTAAAAAAQTQAVQAIAAAVAKLSAQIASSTLAHDAFERTGALGSNWSTQIFTPAFIGGGYPILDGAQMVWQPGGLVDTTAIYRWLGTNRLATTDYTENAIVLGTPLGTSNVIVYDDIYSRMSDDGLTWVRCRVGNEGPGASVMRMQFAVNGAMSEMGAVSIPPGAAGTTAKLYCGTSVDIRQFVIIIDNTTYVINDPHGASQVGALYRGRGCGQFASGFLFGQNQAGSIADWQANDVTAPTGVATIYDGGGAADGDPTADTLGTLVFGGR